MPEQPFTTTCIRVQTSVLAKMRRLALLKAEQQGRGRVSVSATLSDLAEAELARLERKDRRRDA